MTGPIAIDTPDYQRGIIHPQILLATVAANTATVAVPLPPNTETLLVQCWGGVPDPRVTVVGTTTRYSYPGQKTNSSAYAFASPTYLFDVSPALDEQVTVTFNTAPTSQWSVYADSGAHTVVDLGAYRDANGVQFMVPTAPSGGNWDHPPVEISVAGTGTGVSGALVAAPGAGRQLRVFSLSIAPSASTVNASLNNGSGGTVLAASQGGYPVTVTPHPQGVPLSTNTELYYTQSGAGSSYAIAYYTTETV